MTSTLYIDGIDAYSRFGVFPTDGALRSVVGLPSSKTPDYNDWQEEDGIEADLTDGLFLEARDISLSLANTGFSNKYMGLLELLGDRQQHAFEFRDIGRSYVWRWTDAPSAFAHLRDLATFTLRFKEDDPTKYLPQSGIEVYKYPRYCDEYEIDGIPASDLGFLILEGSRTDVFKHSAIKTPLTHSSTRANGITTDIEADVRFKTRELKIKCFMHCPLEHLWVNYDQLLYRLTRPEARRIEASFIGENFDCYYKSCTVDEFLPRDTLAWLKFTLTFVAVDGARLTDDWLLATEDGRFIVLEDNPEETSRGYILLGKNK